MAVKSLPTWIVVLDSTQARFYALRQSDEGQVFEEIADALAAAPRESARPGRSFAKGVARGVVEPRQNARKLDKRDFMEDVAEKLNKAASKREYSRLVLAAPPRSLGELRELMSEKALGCLIHEIPKTLTKLPTDALWTKLSEILLAAAKPLTKKQKAEVVPGVPVSVVFRSTEGSSAIQTDALKFAAKLSRKYTKVESCKVTIATSKRVTQKGKPFSVSLDVMMGGRKFTSKSEGGGIHMRENAHSALRDAFSAADRQLHALAGRRMAIAKPRRAAMKREVAEA